MPLSFHILTSNEGVARAPRGPKINSFMSIIRGNQDIIGTFIFGGVFERNPKLKIVCVEADAGWVPHFMYRMDHAFDRHRYWMTAGKLSKMPSEYFRENIYMTFQDDWVAFKMKDMCNQRRLMWANDFPHSDSTWPQFAGTVGKAYGRADHRGKGLAAARQCRAALRTVRFRAVRRSGSRLREECKLNGRS